MARPDLSIFARRYAAMLASARPVDNTPPADDSNPPAAPGGMFGPDVWGPDVWSPEVFTDEQP